MNKNVFFTLFLLLIIESGLFCQSAAEKNLRLWYDKPANSSAAVEKSGWGNDPEWLKALPVGNGFLGAMVFGKNGEERIQRRGEGGH